MASVSPATSDGAACDAYERRGACRLQANAEYAKALCQSRYAPCARLRPKTVVERFAFVSILFPKADLHGNDADPTIGVPLMTEADELIMMP